MHNNIIASNIVLDEEVDKKSIKGKLEDLAKLAEKNGFKLVKIIDLLPVNHDNSYIYIFQKNYGM